MRSQQDTAGRLLGIDEINWRSLPAVYGDAGDTPKLIRRLYKAQKFQKAADELDYSLFHQGFITRAAIVAVPFFAEVAADQSAPGRHEALGLLVGYAESISMKGCRPADLGHPKMDRQAHAALTACVPVLRPGLDDDDPQVRCDTAEILSLVERLPDDVTRALRARLVAETDDTVLGALVGALLVHGGLDEDEVARLRGCS
ncbi:MAG: hypothetical protein FWD11_03825, partial [Micrococcales bacterium]|nr:hypothetical protein [Micrococcales bacterium]